MNNILSHYKALIDAGDISPYSAIPNKTFTFGELEYLYMKGYIYEDNDEFKAAITEL